MVLALFSATIFMLSAARSCGFVVASHGRYSALPVRSLLRPSSVQFSALAGGVNPRIKACGSGSSYRHGMHSSLLSRSSSSSTVSITFIDELSGERKTIDAPVGKTVLDVALEHDVNLEAACGGELACSTCHVHVSPDHFRRLPKRKVEEDDMLDLAKDVTDYSRLCCQVKVAPELEGAEFSIPASSSEL